MIVQVGGWFVLWFAEIIFVFRNICDVLSDDEVDFSVDPVTYIYCDLVPSVDVLSRLCSCK
jgi:hypothetical protein